MATEVAVSLQILEILKKNFTVLLFITFIVKIILGNEFLNRQNFAIGHTVQLDMHPGSGANFGSKLNLSI